MVKRQSFRHRPLAYSWSSNSFVSTINHRTGLGNAPARRRGVFSAHAQRFNFCIKQRALSQDGIEYANVYLQSPCRPGVRSGFVKRHKIKSGSLHGDAANQLLRRCFQEPVFSKSSQRRDCKTLARRRETLTGESRSRVSDDYQRFGWDRSGLCHQETLLRSRLSKH